VKIFQQHGGKGLYLRLFPSSFPRTPHLPRKQRRGASDEKKKISGKKASDVCVFGKGSDSYRQIFRALTTLRVYRTTHLALLEFKPCHVCTYSRSTLSFDGSIVSSSRPSECFARLSASIGKSDRAKLQARLVSSESFCSARLGY